MAQGLVRRIVVEQHPCHSRPIRVSGSELSINWPEQGQDCARKVVHRVAATYAQDRRPSHLEHSCL